MKGEKKVLLFLLFTLLFSLFTSQNGMAFVPRAEAEARFGEYINLASGPIPGEEGVILEVGISPELDRLVFIFHKDGGIWGYILIDMRTGGMEKRGFDRQI